MEVINDNSCSWVNDLSPRNNIKSLSSNLNCEWLIIGAGFTGLSAARKLGQHIDTTLNDGFTSNKKLEGYKKTDIYKLGIDVVVSLNNIK